MRESFNNLRQLLEEKETLMQKINLEHRESLINVQVNVKNQTTKHKQEIEYLKKQFLSEIEMNKRNMEQMLINVQ